MVRCLSTVLAAVVSCTATSDPTPVPVEDVQGIAGSEDVGVTLDVDVDTEPTPDKPPELDVPGLDVPEPVPTPTCDAPVGGDVPLLVSTSVEAQPGYDELLAALVPESLPDPIDLSILSTIHRSLVAYMLEIDLDTLPDTMARDEILATEPMGPAVLLAFSEAAAAGTPGADLVTLRRGLHRFYQCTRQFPLRLEDFQNTVLDYADLEPYEVHSMPKNDIRRIREDSEAGVYVAETLIGGTVRETEILMSHNRSDGALDFVVYDHKGDLVDRSEFVTAAGGDISGAAPYACIACHFEPGTFRITVLFPDL